MDIEFRDITSRDEWLDWRKGDLTASDVPAVLGVDNRRSALQVYGEKTGMLIADEATPIMRRGLWFEHAGVAALNDEYPAYNWRRALVYVRAADLRLAASPDVLGENPKDRKQLVNCQIKVVSRPVFERSWSNGVPLPVQLQSLTEALLLDAPLNKVAALVVDTYTASLHLFDVPRHAEAEKRIVEIASTFWTNVRLGVRPAVDYMRDDEVIAQIFPKEEEGKVVDFTGDNHLASLLAERKLAKATIRGCEAQVSMIDTEIKAKLEDAERAALPGWKLSWKQETRSAYTVPEKTSRVLRISEEKEKAA